MRGLLPGRRREQAAAVLAALEAFSPFPAEEEEAASFTGEASAQGSLSAGASSPDRREAQESTGSAPDWAEAPRPAAPSRESIWARGQKNSPVSTGEAFSTPSPAWGQNQTGETLWAASDWAELDRLLERDARRYERDFTLY